VLRVGITQAVALGVLGQPVPEEQAGGLAVQLDDAAFAAGVLRLGEQHPLVRGGRTRSARRGRVRRRADRSPSTPPAWPAVRVRRAVSPGIRVITFAAQGDRVAGMAPINTAI